MLGTTPMFKQYETIKKDYTDCILFYRMGDFYEMFGIDAEEASRILGIALTARDGGQNIRVPMCGVPHHAAETYLGKLIRAGRKVAICEQLEDPKQTKGIVKRGVIRVVTPGMLIDDAILRKGSNHIVAVSQSKQQFGFAVADVSTGRFMATQLKDEQSLYNELDRFDPAECICSADDPALFELLSDQWKRTVNRHLGFAFEPSNARIILKEHFQVNDLAVFGYRPEENNTAMMAAGGLMDYMKSTLKQTPGNITVLSFYRQDRTMVLDSATRRNLELVRAIGEQDRNFTLLGILDQTVTAAGSRMLKDWLDSPLKDPVQIAQRLDATEELVGKNDGRHDLRRVLSNIHDVERIVSRISYGSANAKDLLALRNSLYQLPDIAVILNGLEAAAFSAMNRRFDALADVHVLLHEAVHDDAPFSLREGRLIKDGYNPEVDTLREMVGEGRGWIDSFAEKERERTGIKNLKIGYNKVFGYYIDVTKSQLDKVPEDYIRKQTLVNNERYVTPALKEMEDKVVGADERLRNLEYELFAAVRTQLQQHIERFLTTSRILAGLDVFAALAETALKNNYCKPMLSERDYHVTGLRHPVVENALQGIRFVPNDARFIRGQEQFLIITGPNMSGKSTYCRSVALASIMMQIGSFVPAETAHMPVVDRVFARIGANDQLSHGQSTFMVEMNEVANILNHATMDSLIVLDEVGRGTSTFDGLSIAYAICKYINERIGAKTLFATHYHELTRLSEDPGIANYSIAVQDDGSDVVFMHTIVPGAANKSYGVHVGKMAGLPPTIIEAAERMLLYLEQNAAQDGLKKGLNDETLQAMQESEARRKAMETIINRIRLTDVQDLSIGDSVNFIVSLQKEVDKLFGE